MMELETYTVILTDVNEHDPITSDRDILNTYEDRQGKSIAQTL